jgi:ABC-type multidrug transport system ATPase subunit
MLHTYPVLNAEGVTTRYGKRAELTDCSLNVPWGRVIGLVCPTMPLDSPGAY